MQAAPAPSSPPISRQPNNDHIAAGGNLPSEDISADIGDRSPEIVNNPQQLDAEMATASTPVSMTQHTALPGIRDLFPDHLFESQQRLDPATDARPRDLFLAHAASMKRQTQVSSEAERQMRREAFAAMTASSPTTSRMQPRSPYFERGGFAFPGPPAAVIRAPHPPHPSSAPNFAASPVVHPPLPPPISAHGRISIPSSSGANNTIPSLSPPTTRTDSTRPRRGHAHTYSSDASAAAAGLLGLSLSGGPSANTSPLVMPNGVLERRSDGKGAETDDNDDESMLGFEMNESRGERVKAENGEANKDRRDRDEEMEIEEGGVEMETAATSVDSHASVDIMREKKASRDVSSGQDPSLSPKAEEEEILRTKVEEGNSTSIENGCNVGGGVGDREPASSAENETGEGDVEGEGDGGDGKRHTCPHCKKRFNRPSSLKIHLNTHTGAKPFECPFPGCGRQFNVSSNMRRHYRNHQSSTAPGMGMGVPMSVHEPFGSRPPPHGLLGLQVGSTTGYSNSQLAQTQMQRELERERVHRERMLMQGHVAAREGYSQYGPPSAYRPPHHPNANGAPFAPSQVSRVPHYGSYPPGFGPREGELERRERERERERERFARLERENWEFREREREREPNGRLERRVPPPGYPTQMHPAYARRSPPQYERSLDYRAAADPSRPVPDSVYYQQGPARGVPPPYPNSQPPPHPQSQNSYSSQPHPQARPPAAGSTPALRSSRSFSHPYASPHALPYPRSSPSHSRSRERYSSGAGSPVVSPALAAAASLPVQGWRGHAHTQSAPAFQGLGHRGIELPPLMTTARSPYNRDVPHPSPSSGHGRSHSYSAASTYVGPGPSLLPPSTFACARDGGDEERSERRARRDSTAALTGHESDREATQGGVSDFEGEDKREESDVDMRDAVGERINRGWPLSPTSGMASSPLRAVSPSVQRENATYSKMEQLHRRPSNSQVVVVPRSSTSRDRAYSQPHSYHTHSRTGSGSSSGHGHGYAAHPYARARHAHSRSREAAAVVPEVVSPRVHASLSSSPRPSLPNMSTSVSPRASVSSAVSPGPGSGSGTGPVPGAKQNGVNADVRPLRETGTSSTSDRGSKLLSSTSSPVSATGPGRNLCFPVYTFPPPVPPAPASVLPSASPPVGSTAMEVEN